MRKQDEDETGGIDELCFEDEDEPPKTRRKTTMPQAPAPVGACIVCGGEGDDVCLACRIQFGLDPDGMRVSQWDRIPSLG